MNHSDTAGTRSRVLELGAIALFFCGFVILTYVVFVKTEWGQAVEDAALAGRTIESQQLISDAWHLLDTISVVSLGIVVGVLAAYAAIRRRPALAFAAAAMVLGANVTTQLLKRVILDRPDLVDGATTLLHNSYPSGHSTVALTVAMAPILVAPSRFRALTAVAGSAYAVSVGAAVVAAGWHRPSDAVGAWFVVGAWTMVSLAVLAATERMPVTHRLFRSTRAVIFVFAVLSAVLGAVGLAGVAVSDRWYLEGAFNELHEGTAFVTSTAGVVSMGLATIAIVLVAVRGVSIGTKTPARASGDRSADQAA